MSYFLQKALQITKKLEISSKKQKLDNYQHRKTKPLMGIQSILRKSSTQPIFEWDIFLSNYNQILSKMSINDLESYYTDNENQYDFPECYLYAFDEQPVQIQRNYLKNVSDCQKMPTQILKLNIIPTNDTLESNKSLQNERNIGLQKEKLAQNLNINSYVIEPENSVKEEPTFSNSQISGRSNSKAISKKKQTKKQEILQNNQIFFSIDQINQTQKVSLKKTQKELEPRYNVRGEKETGLSSTKSTGKISKEERSNFVNDIILKKLSLLRRSTILTLMSKTAGVWSLRHIFSTLRSDLSDCQRKNDNLYHIIFRQLI